MRQQKQGKKYAITCYTYITGEPDDSSISVIGVYHSFKKANKVMIETAEKDLQSMIINDN